MPSSLLICFKYFITTLEVIGSRTGIESLFNYGKEVVAQQDKDIKEGNYQPEYTMGLREAYQQGGLSDAIGWVAEKTGAEFNLVTADGGAEVVKLILGGQVLAGFASGEHFQYLESGDMKVIAGAVEVRWHHGPIIGAVLPVVRFTQFNARYLGYRIRLIGRLQRPS